MYIETGTDIFVKKKKSETNRYNNPMSYSCSVHKGYLGLKFPNSRSGFRTSGVTTVLNFLLVHFDFTSHLNSSGKKITY
jgi:hypothetical protein